MKRPPNLRSARTLKVIVVESYEGLGTPESVGRIVTTFYHLNGDFIARVDPRPDVEEPAIRFVPGDRVARSAETPGGRIVGTVLLDDGGEYVSVLVDGYGASNSFSRKSLRLYADPIVETDGGK